LINESRYFSVKFLVYAALNPLIHSI